MTEVLHHINLAIEASFNHSFDEHLDLREESVLFAHDNYAFQASDVLCSNE